jgi:hypothetical protein
VGQVFLHNNQMMFRRNQMVWCSNQMVGGKSEGCGSLPEPVKGAPRVPGRSGTLGDWWDCEVRSIPLTCWFSDCSVP